MRIESEYEKVLRECNTFIKNTLPFWDDCRVVKFIYDKFQDDTIYIKQELSEFYFSFNTLQEIIQRLEKEILSKYNDYHYFVSLVQSKAILVQSYEYGTEWTEYEYEISISIQ